jgi:glycosyltransferase involved in cell wall biosynthesis
MKILIATDTYHPSVNGAAYFTYRLAGALAQKRHEVFVICPSKLFKNTIVDEDGVMVYGVRSIAIPVYQNFRIAPLFLSKGSIEEIIKNISPDVIHIQNHFMVGKGALITAKKFAIPIMGTNHFMPENLVHYFHLPKFAENWLIRFGWKQCVEVFEQLDSVTTPTKTAAELLRRAGLTKKITALSCGIDLERFKPTNNGEYLKERYAIPKNKKVLLYVGRLDKEKRIDVIVRALPTILEKTQAHLVLAGIGKERSFLEHLVQSLNLNKHVTFTGFIPDEDLQNIYKVATVFTIAGVAELQSIVTMEAIASGLPVVAVNVLALPELVHDGENGYVFSDGDSQTLAQKVILILSDEKVRKEMSERGLEIIKMHDIHTIIGRYEALYHEIINR